MLGSRPGRGAAAGRDPDLGEQVVPPLLLQRGQYHAQLQLKQITSLKQSE
jgi:hypothetical protein